MLSVVCSASIPPKRRRPTPVCRRTVKQAIKQAHLMCKNYEDTIECRLAWEHVEELSSALARQKRQEPEEPERSELAKRDYEL